MARKIKWRDIWHRRQKHTPMPTPEQRREMETLDTDAVKTLLYLIRNPDRLRGLQSTDNSTMVETAF